MRACTIQESGNVWFRSLTPARYTNGIVERATIVRPTWIENMKTSATTKLRRLSATSGAKVRNICTDRMSEFAREMSCPDCTRS